MDERRPQLPAGNPNGTPRYCGQDDSQDSDWVAGSSRTVLPPDDSRGRSAHRRRTDCGGPRSCPSPSKRWGSPASRVEGASASGAHPGGGGCLLVAALRGACRETDEQPAAGTAFRWTASARPLAQPSVAGDLLWRCCSAPWGEAVGLDRGGSEWVGSAPPGGGAGDPPLPAVPAAVHPRVVGRRSARSGRANTCELLTCTPMARWSAVVDVEMQEKRDRYIFGRRRPKMYLSHFSPVPVPRWQPRARQR